MAALTLTEELTLAQPADRIDLLPYLRGDGRIYSVSNPNGFELMGTVRIADGSWLQQKNQNWEHLSEDGQIIYRGLDTSEAEDRFYVQARGNYYGEEGSRYGAPWIARFMAVGDVYRSTPYVTHYFEPDTPDGEARLRDRGRVTNFMRVEALFDEWNGVKDVVELAWYGGENPDGNPFAPRLETYFYGRDFGLVGWQNNRYRDRGGFLPQRKVIPGFNLFDLDFELRPASPEVGGGAEGNYTWLPAVVTRVANNNFTNIRATIDDPRAGNNPKVGEARVGDSVDVAAFDIRPNAVPIRFTNDAGERIQAFVLGTFEWSVVEGADPEEPETPVEPGRLEAIETRLSLVEGRVDALNGAYVLSTEQVQGILAGLKAIEAAATGVVDAINTLNAILTISE
ncbi:MAG: hypothetical protein AAGK74_00335 [Chloroflexota bacterium]